MIAHRLSTIKNSDKIIGFHEGEALESGNHNELLKVKNGIYQNLVHMQTYESESTGFYFSVFNSSIFLSVELIFRKRR